MGYDAPSGSLDGAVDIDVDANPFSGVNPFDGDWNPFSGVGADVTLSEDLVNLAGVSNEGLATQGGANLSQFVDGLRATHEGERGNLSVIGHSYGSTTAAHAASDGGLDADSLTLLGSPGAGHNAPTAEDLGMPPGRVYVGSADNDPVTWLGDRDSSLGLGADPSQEGYGATRIEVDNGEDFHLDSLSQGLDNHTSYFDPEANPESLANVGAIVSGDDPTTIDGRDQAARDHARDFAEDEADYWADKGREELEDRFVDPVVGFGQDVYETGRDAAEWTGDRADDVADAAETAYDNTLGRLPGL
jgi:pimeloyl-ACP methyl ester carboxylesterase